MKQLGTRNYLMYSTCELRQIGGCEMGIREPPTQHIHCASYATPPAIALDTP